MSENAEDKVNFGTLGDCESLPFPQILDEWWCLLPSEVHFISDLISINGGGCWIVGGTIRDAIALSKKADEIDMATDLIPSEIIRIFDHTIFQDKYRVTVLPTGLKFGTVTLRFESGLEIEITTFRTESSYTDGRRPDSVSFGKSLSDDLLRRDFTVNAMAIDVSRKILHDPFNGLLDVRSKIIRAVGDPNIRLSEDGLRVLRAYRFVGNFYTMWTIEDNLRNALKISINMLENVAKERIWNELKKIFISKYAGNILSLMAEDCMLDIILHGKYHTDSKGILSQFNPTIADNVSDKLPIARLSLLLVESLNKNITNDFSLIRLSNEEVRNFNRIFNSLGRLPNPSYKSELRLWRYFHDSNEKVMLALEESLAMTYGIENTDTVSKIRDELLKLEPLSAGNKPLANGNWIMQRTGLSKGPRLGKLKSWLHTIQIERDLPNLGEIESVLCTLPWNQENYDQWPSPIWPK